MRNNFDMQRELLARLGQEWNIVVTVERSRSYKGSACWPRSKLIRLSHVSRLGYGPVCYHEFAHIVAETRKPGYGHRHDKNFFHTLVDILEKEGIIATYPWHREYTRIYQWAQKEGYATPETVNA